MRVTFDSNIWEKVVSPDPSCEPSLQDDYMTVHDALRDSRIHGFICETVGTLEAVKRKGRKQYFGSITPQVRVDVADQGSRNLSLNLSIVPNHDQHPGLPDVLLKKLNIAFALGIRLLRAPRIGLPIPALFLDSGLFADENDIPSSAARDNRWGDLVAEIETRGVGSAKVRSLERDLISKDPEAEDKAFAAAVAEWADGDSVAAHLAYCNGIFCTHDEGRHSKGPSVLDPENRRWLTSAYGVEFATIKSLASVIRSSSSLVQLQC
jgi:hypothetical protein